MFLPENELDIAVILIVSSTSAAFLLLAVWASLANWPAWYIRVGVMGAALAALFPVKAYEPAALFLLVMPLVVVAMRLFYRESTPRAAIPAASVGQAKWLSFTLRDLLLAMTFIAIASAMIASLWRKQAFVEWQRLLITAATLTPVAIFSAGIVVSRKRRWLQLLGLLPCLAALVAWQHKNWYFSLGLGSIVYNYNFDENSYSRIDPIYHCVFLDVLLVLSIALPLAATRLAMRQTIDTPHRHATVAARRALSIGGIILAVPSAALYWWMLQTPELLEHNFPRENSLPRVLALLNEAQALTKSEASVVEAEDATDSLTAQKLARLYVEMQDSLREPGYVNLDLTRADIRIYSRNEEPSRVRSQAGRWRAEAEQAASDGRSDRASHYCVAAIQLGHAYSRGGIWNHFLSGMGAESTGVAALAKIRAELSVGGAQEVIRQLESVDQSREKVEVVEQRNDVWYDRAYGWRDRIRRSAGKLIPGSDRNRVRLAIQLREAAARRDALLRLLMAEQAIRLYREEREELPKQLADLAPDFLSATPLDPFSGRPLVYRRTGEQYVLYSVWTDRIDDGGTFPRSPNERVAPGFDFDLDADTRIHAEGTGS